MAEDTMSPSLEPIEEGEPLELMRRVIGEHHPGLADAKFQLFWALQKPNTWWGKTVLATEKMWWLSNVDVILDLNQALWEKLSEDGRCGLLDHLLSMVSPKSSGKTEMQTSRGTRQLFESQAPSLSVHPQVLARNPTFVNEIAELASLRKAIEEPSQFLLDFAKASDQDEEEEAA